MQISDSRPQYTHTMIPVLGATSILGYNLTRLYPAATIPVCTSRSKLPLTKSWYQLRLDHSAAIHEFFMTIQPDCLLYCDAVCDVEKCENNPDWAREINVGNLQRVLHAAPGDLRICYVSSDHVFGGDGVYSENSLPCPVSKYAGIRAEAEQLVLSRENTLVIRPGLPIGPSIDGRSGHYDWLRYRMLRELPVTIVTDELRSAAHVEDQAARIMALAKSCITGIRHLAVEQPVWRTELASRLVELMQLPGTLLRESRFERTAPHLGHVQLETLYTDALAARLPSIMERLETVGVSSRQKEPIESGVV